MRNHLGSYECKLCLTLHTNEGVMVQCRCSHVHLCHGDVSVWSGSYLAHTQGKKHQINLARRAAREKQDTSIHQCTITYRHVLSAGRAAGCDDPAAAADFFRNRRIWALLASLLKFSVHSLSSSPSGESRRTAQNCEDWPARLSGDEGSCLGPVVVHTSVPFCFSVPGGLEERDPDSQQKALLFEIEYPEVSELRF